MPYLARLYDPPKLFAMLEILTWISESLIASIVRYVIFRLQKVAEMEREKFALV